MSRPRAGYTHRRLSNKARLVPALCPGVTCTMYADRPLPGIVLMLAFCVLAPLGDSFAKILGEIIALGVLLMIRFATLRSLREPVFQ